MIEESSDSGQLLETVAFILFCTFMDSVNPSWCLIVLTFIFHIPASVRPDLCRF